MRILLLFLLLSFQSLLYAQNFWQKTSPLPKQEIPLLISGQGTDIYVLSMHGRVYTSPDKGKNWNDLLQCEKAGRALYTQESTLLIADEQFVYCSNDRGISWTKTPFPGNYPPAGFFIDSRGNYFALSGDLISLQKGDMLWKSEDAGKTWVKRSGGLQGNGYFNRMQEDSYGRLYVASADDGTGGALYYSDDAGNSWQRHALTIDGKGAIDDDIYIRQTIGFHISSDDSIRIGIQGASGTINTIMTNMTLVNHRNLQGEWRIEYVGGPNHFWEETPLYSLGYNGCSLYYGSHGPMIQKGGAYIKTPGGNWERRVSGLDITPSGYGALEMSSLSNGTLIAVQWSDPSIYYSDSAACFSLNTRPTVNEDLRVYPNPSTGIIYLQSEMTEAFSIQVFNMQGKLVSEEKKAIQIDLSQLQDGHYLLIIQGDGIIKREWIHLKRNG